MRIALGADDSTQVVEAIFEFLRARGHAVTRFGRAAGEDEPWAATGRRVAESVVSGAQDLGIVCCWTGTGVSIAANKVAGAEPPCAWTRKLRAEPANGMTRTSSP